MKANYVQNGVCAVLVTFRPNEAVEANLAAIRPQVESLVVVDNGSSNQSVSWLRGVCERFSIHLIENGDNLGLPSALNIGIEWVMTKGYRWVMLLDQDSTATGGMVETMLEAYRIDSYADKIGIVVPKYINRVTKEIAWCSPPFVGNKRLAAAWTSGSLILIDVLTKVGGFEACLFIDLLDQEFSLRVRDAGYSISLADCASLLHEPGSPKTHRLLGMFPMTTSNHIPARRYYCARNRVWIVRKYHSRFRGLAQRECARQVKELIWILICEKNRWRMLRSVACGIKDGMIGRMGKTVEL
jgi:rhamnosyltransferase